VIRPDLKRIQIDLCRLLGSTPRCGVLQRLRGEIGRTISDVQKRDKQTNKQKTPHFWPPRLPKSELNHGDRGPRARSCTSKTFLGL